MSVATALLAAIPVLTNASCNQAFLCHMPPQQLIVPCLYVPNLYVPNLYVPNLYVPNLYVPNLYVPNLYVPNLYVPNLGMVLTSRRST